MYSGSYLLDVGDDFEAELSGLVKVVDEDWHEGHDVEGEPHILGGIEHSTCREQRNPGKDKIEREEGSQPTYIRTCMHA